MDLQDLVLEACVETFEQAVEAEKQGAHRIELCAQLEHGGLTPSKALVKRLQSQLRIPIKVMIRPRPGDFVYNKMEIAQMAEEIRYFKDQGIPEIVLGLLTPQRNIDLNQLAYLATVAEPLPITFHKAVDDTGDPLAELTRMKAVKNVKSILSSGKQATALEGGALLREMIRQFGDRYNIIAAGKITAKNLVKVHKLVGGREYHGRKII